MKKLIVFIAQKWNLFVEKKLIIFVAVLISAAAHSQVDWSNYSTSFTLNNGRPCVGVAIPYNGNHDNHDQNVVGISDWNPGYNYDIDTALADTIPLYFVYDTAGIIFLFPGITKANASSYEFTILLNNRTPLTSWMQASRFTDTQIGGLMAGAGMSDTYKAGIGQYLVAILRNRTGKTISSTVIYFKKSVPVVKSISTSDDKMTFLKFVEKPDQFRSPPAEIGWHRQYSRDYINLSSLALSETETSVLVEMYSAIYRRDALEYRLEHDNEKMNKWSPNKYDNNFVLLTDLEPGNYKLQLRYKRQRESVTTLNFKIPPAWYQAKGFRLAVASGLILALAFLLLFGKYRKQRQAAKLFSEQAEQSTEELNSIHALLNPHFTYNALNSIQSLVNKNDIQAANNYLASFGDLLRENLKEIKTEHIPLSKELENLKTYISLEQLRHSFTYNIAIDPGIDLSVAMIPPFLTQPFVENAIKHAVAKINATCHLGISVDKSNQEMKITISDDGKGFDPSLIKEGYGLSLSKKRIALLNRKYGEELITFKIETKQMRTSVILIFKNWL